MNPGLQALAPEELDRTLWDLFSSPTSSPSASVLRGTLPVGIVSDVGQYFPFENRETPLRALIACLAAHLKWHREQRNEPQPEKSLDFTVCHGLSGVGKTTFVTDGFAHVSRTGVAEEFHPEVQPILSECIENNLCFRLSTASVRLLELEQENPALFLAMRVLYSFLSPHHQISGYKEFFDLYVAPT